MKGLAPYGNKSLVVHDANLQYIEFFSYFKDVLEGKNSLFFNKVDVHNFFDMLVILKISLISISFSYFAINRFNKINENNMYFYILISISFGISQYNIA